MEKGEEIKKRKGLIEAKKYVSKVDFSKSQISRTNLQFIKESASINDPKYSKGLSRFLTCEVNEI